jgi:protein TonB
METKKNKSLNLERRKFTNLMVGFCYVSGLVLATFSYGKTEEVKQKYRTSSFDNSNFYAELKEKPKEVEQPKEKPQPQQSTQKETTLDLNNEIKPNENTNTTIEDKPFVDLDLPKGDTTVIIKNDPIPVITPDKVEDYPDVEAEFLGGYEAWKKYLLKELKYPEISLEMGQQGIVYISFVIEIDGTVSDVKILKGVSFDIDREAKRVIRNSPKWTPGRISKSNVRTRLSIPINFIIE